MKRIIGLTTAALMSASILAAPAFAQDESDMELPSATTTTPDVDTGTTAAIDATFDGALTAIEGNATSAEVIRTMTEVQAVNVVSIGDLEGSDAAAVESAVSANEEGTEELRSSIQSNAALSAELETQGVDATTVVAAEVEADGQVTVFVM